MSELSYVDLDNLAARERRRTTFSVAVFVVLVAATTAYIWYTVSTVTAVRTELAAITENLEQSKLALAQTTDEQARTEEALSQLRVELENATAALDAAKQSLADAEAARDQAVADAERANAEVVRLQAELDRLSSQLADTKEQLAVTSAELEDAEARLSAAEARMAALEEQIGLSVAFSEHLHPVDLEDAKLLSSRSDRLATLLERILQLQQEGTKFKSANELGVGFNSPGFANFILGEVDQGKTLGSLPQTSNPQLGDILQYEGGFAMFLLEDAEAKPFVIGMTPAGIAALEPDFGVPRTGALSTGIVLP
jgi:septal ring factor EnvC (AmiA/AmiB activator)